MGRVSLTTKAEKIGIQRRKIADLQSKRTELISALDAAEENFEKASEALSSWQESDGTPKEKVSEQVTSARETFDKARKAVLAIGDEIRSEQNTLVSMEEDYRIREEHNQTEDRLNSTLGRQLGSDGASLDSAAGTSDEMRIRVKAPDMETQKHDLGVMFQCKMICDVDRLPASDASIIAKERFGNDRVASALQANVHRDGGSLVAGAFSSAWIELLRAQAIIRGSGVPTLPLDDGTMRVGRKTGSSTSYYRGEGEVATPSQPTTGDMTLVSKEMVTLVPATEKLMRSPSANAAQMIRDDIVESAALCEDLHFIRGVPSGAGPTGMRYLAASGNIIAANVTPNLANVTADLGKLELALMSNNVDVTKAIWAMSPRTYIYLMNLRDANGNLAFPELMLNGTLRKKPVKLTTQIPENLSTNQSELYLYVPSAAVIGDGLSMQMVSSNTAAYNLTSTTLASAFSRGEILTRLTLENDFNLRQPTGVAVLTGVAWIP